MLILKPPLPLQANGPWSPPICCRYWKGMSSDTSLCPFRGQGIGGGTRRVCFKYKNASALLLRRCFSPKPPRLNHRGGKMTWSGFPSSPKDGTPRTCRWYILDAQERGQFITRKGGLRTFTLTVLEQGGRELSGRSRLEHLLSRPPREPSPTSQSAPILVREVLPAPSRGSFH